MTWTEHAIWWHVYPLGFCGAPIREADERVTHRLDRLEGWLDYAITLGASGLLLGPVFASESHGYDTVDFFRIDPRLGDDEDFDRLVAACRSRGLRVLLDGVFNHVGAGHPWFRQALAEGPDSERAALFRIDWSGPQPRAADFEGHASLVALNHTHPSVVDLVSDVMRHWQRRGIDGWRLDAAYAVDPAFWGRILPGIREEFPDSFIVGEVIHGDYPRIVAETGMDTVTQYELWKASWSSLLDQNFYELAAALERHNDFLGQFVPQTFIGNHDVTRIASRVGDQQAALALVILCTVGGIPSIYYGDEQAYHGIKYDDWGGDDQVRPPFPPRPEDLSTLGRWLFEVHQQLIGLRRRHPWLVRARTEVVSLANEHIVYDTRPADGGEGLRVDLDLRSGPSATVSSGGDLLFRFPAH